MKHRFLSIWMRLYWCLRDFWPLVLLILLAAFLSYGVTKWHWIDRLMDGK
jgi:hypothetical protein